MEETHQAVTACLKPLPALDYTINILTPNEQSSNRANTFPIFGNGSNTQNVRLSKNPSC